MDTPPSATEPLPTAWMSLTARRRWGRYRFEFGTNVPRVQPLRFVREHSTLQVWLGATPWGRFESWRRATVRGRRYDARLRRLCLAGLQSEGLSLDFEWRPERPFSRQPSERVRITCSQHPGQPYVLQQAPWSLRQPVTALRIECLAPAADPDLMLLCLAYFWNHLETGRTWD